METPYVPQKTSVEIAQQQHHRYIVHPVCGGKRRSEQNHDISAEASVSCPVSSTLTFAQELHKRQRTSLVEEPLIQASPIKNIKTAHSIGGFNPGLDRPALYAPGPSQNALLSLSHPRYGLPPALVQNFTSLGINGIYPWQSSCLLGRDLLEGQRNLVYSAPTGGGKSLVADVLMLKKVIDDPTKKAILVLPYVALVQEKLKWLRKAVEGLRKRSPEITQADAEIPKWRRIHDASVRVVGFFGGSKARVTCSDFDIAVSTIEKVILIHPQRLLFKLTQLRRMHL